MPHPFSTTLLAAAAIMALLGAPIAAVVFLTIALVLEFGRFWVNGVEPPATTTALVRSGEAAPREEI